MYAQALGLPQYEMLHCIRSEILIAATVKICVVRYVTPCSQVKVRFLSILTMEAAEFLETWANIYKSTRLHIQEERNVKIY
jgi:hypothetical protein